MSQQRAGRGQRNTGRRAAAPGVRGDRAGLGPTRPPSGRSAARASAEQSAGSGLGLGTAPPRDRVGRPPRSPGAARPPAPRARSQAGRAHQAPPPEAPVRDHYFIILFPEQPELSPCRRPGAAGRRESPSFCAGRSCSAPAAPSPGFFFFFFPFPFRSAVAMGYQAVAMGYRTEAAGSLPATQSPPPPPPRAGGAGVRVCGTRRGGERASRGGAAANRRPRGPPPPAGWGARLYRRPR